MLRTRLITAAILMPLVVYGVLRLDTRAVACILALVFCAAVWEWTRLVPLHAGWARALYTGVAALLMWLLWELLHFA